MNRRQIMGLLGMGVLGVPIAGCRDTGESEPGLLVATTTMVGDLLRSLAGGLDEEVAVLMGAQVDPHLFKPGQSDVRKLRRATVVLYSGLHLEGRMAEILERMARHGRQVVAVTDGIAPDRLMEAEGAIDPHVWGDASVWAEAVQFAGDRLGAFLPEHREAIAARTTEQVAALRACHDRLRARAQEIPEAQRVLVTSHDAFQYFGRAYGFAVMSVQGIATVSEAALADMARISAAIRQRKVPAVFVESSISPATIRRISEETGAVLGGELCSDALGIPGEMASIAGGRSVDRGTVAGMLESNMDIIVRALGGSAAVLPP
jgi:manganese/zinc/iron transport system substrate-binding protein